MSVLPPHIKPTTREDCIDTWRSKGRIAVPSRKGQLMDMGIVHFYECGSVDGMPLDLLIEARATKRAPLKRFGVVFADDRPLDDYPIPVLWVREGTGSWIGNLT